jgi:hypothetical protein
MPISTFPRHDYDEDKFFLKPAGLRDTHSEGKVTGCTLVAASTKKPPRRVAKSVTGA